MDDDTTLDTSADTTTLDTGDTNTGDTSTGDTGTETPSGGWSADDPAFREAVAAQATEVAQAQFQQMLAGLAGTDEQQEQADFQLDPFAEDYGQQLQQLMAQSNQQMLAQVQQLLGPLLNQHEQTTNAEGQQRIKDIISDITTREGDLTNEGKGAVESIAPLFLEQYENTYGQGARAAEMALGQAAKVIRGIETAAALKAVERYKNELSTIGGARGLPVGGATGIEGGPRPTSVIDAGRRFAERHAAGSV